MTGPRYRYQYKPDVSISLSPRVTKVLRNKINRVCKRAEMPEADVVRFSFEAIVLAIDAGVTRFPRFTPGHSFDSMVSIRTSAVIRRKIEKIFVAAQRTDSTVRQSDVLRQLIEMAVALALKRGMAHMVALRERLL